MRNAEAAIHAARSDEARSETVRPRWSRFKLEARPTRHSASTSRQASAQSAASFLAVLTFLVVIRAYAVCPAILVTWLRL